jgi:hypothetical protein
MKIALPVLLATFALPSLAHAQDSRPNPEAPALVVVPRVTAFAATVRGRVRADEGSFPSPISDGTSVNFESDLDLDDSDPVWILEIAAFQRGEGFYLERASISYLEASYDGRSTLDSTEVFNARTFPAGTAVDSKVRYRSWGADFAVVEGEPLFENTSGSMLLGARYTDLRVSMEGGGQQTDERLRLFWLGVGFRGETRWGGWLSGILQASVYFTYGAIEDWFDLKEWGGVLFEGMAGVSGTLGPVQLEAGLRLISSSMYSTVDTSDKFEDNDFLLQLGGPYFSATLRF